MALDTLPVYSTAVGTAADIDERIYVRYTCPSKPMVRLLAKPSFITLQARVRDVSITGIGLTYHRRLKPGTVLAILLENERSELTRIAVARVSRAVAEPRGHWLMGCKFKGRLSAEEIRTLLQ